VDELHARAQREVGSSLMPGLFDHWLPLTEDPAASLARLAEALHSSHPQQVCGGRRAPAGCAPTICPAM
jgi:hypothetical protein